MIGAVLGSFIRHPGTWFGAAMLIGSLTWGTVQWVKVKYLRVQLATATERVRGLEDANDRIAGQVRECNSAVAGLARASTAAMDRAAKALERVSAENAKTQARQTALEKALAAKPAGAGCKEGLGVARKSLDEEMR